MNKKDYVDAMNEIHPRESLKKETFNKITQSKKRKYNKLYPLMSAAIMVAIIIGIGVPLHNSHPLNENKIEAGKTIETVTAEGLPKVENFENLYAMLTKIDNSGGLLYGNSVDSMITNDATNSTDSSKQEASEEYSDTNTQVEGVDEADIVKTDGNYIYYLTKNNLKIVDAQKMSVMATVEFDETDFYSNELYVKGDKVIVIGNRYESGRKEYSIDSMYTDIMYAPGTSYTVIKVFDISNRAKPQLARTVEIEGYYLSSRMIDNDIYLMANKSIYAYELKNKDIDELDEKDYKPKYKDTAISDEIKYVEFQDMCYIPNIETANYLNIVSFDVTNNEKANVDTYLGAGSEIYASDKNLYITRVIYNYEEENNYREYETSTEIYKFNLVEGKCNFDKAGEVPGGVLNQFSMDENGEYFRIATTSNKDWDSENNTNNLYVLNAKLEIIGKVEGLAKGERIYSVRFMGDRAYMVTFVETDPLFVIDLSNPTNPTVLGELKIPGYSKYLHPYDETHIIGFGERTKVVNYGYGDQVITDGMKMALFDVTDPNNPKELYSVDIGERGTYSELLYNHKALLFSKEKNIIAFPISVTEDDYEVTFQGAIVYGLNLEEGFTLKGEISHIEEGYDLYKSGNRVNRIIYINDKLYTLSNDLIKVTDMNTMEELDHIDL